MYRFQITLHAKPANLEQGEIVELSEGRFQTLDVQPAALATPMGVSFEQASQSLASIPRMFVEPDGSLVWTADDGRQIDGVLYDRGERLLYVELQGVCLPEEFDRLLAAFDWPQSPLIFQLRRQAIFLGEEEFRRFAAAS